MIADSYLFKYFASLEIMSFSLPSLSVYSEESDFYKRYKSPNILKRKLKNSYQLSTANHETKPMVSLSQQAQPFSTKPLNFLVISFLRSFNSLTNY